MRRIADGRSKSNFDGYNDFADSVVFMSHFWNHATTRRLASLAMLAIVLFQTGCGTFKKTKFTRDLDRLQGLANDISFPDAVSTEIDAQLSAPPITIYDQAPAPREITLQEAIEIALTNSTVIRNLGGAIIRAPQAAETVYEPAIQETGVPAALSAFDTQFAASMFWEKNDRAINNRFLGGGTNILQQDLGNYEFEFSKVTAGGGTFQARKSIEYDANNAPGNLFGSAWTVNVEAEFRQPLLQGRGVGFNRIAGPNASPGNINGVVIARLNSDISVSQFEESLRDLVNEVENAYWDLYYSYRVLATKNQARDAALAEWKRAQSLGASDLPGGGAEQEALARAQYYRFQMEAQNALSGKLLEGTRSSNGSRPGTFQGSLGVHAAERRLRLLMGVPISDGHLMRPAFDPALTRVVFDWGSCLGEAMTKRSELRRQQIQIRKAELQLAANKNFLMPELDAIGRYRWRGFGRDLTDVDRDDEQLSPFLRPAQFDNAYQDLTTGDFQEWQLGLEFRMPIGYRQAYAAVHRAELVMSRERAVLDEMERQVSYELSAAIADMHRAYEVCRSAFNRRVAVRKRLELLLERDKTAGKVDRSLMLDAQRQVADADAEYFRCVTEHVLAVKNVHFVKGSLMQYHSISLAGEAAPPPAPGPPQLDYRLEELPYSDTQVSPPPVDVAPQPEGPEPEAIQPPPANEPMPIPKVNLAPMPLRQPTAIEQRSSTRQGEAARIPLVGPRTATNPSAPVIPSIDTRAKAAPTVIMGQF